MNELLNFRLIPLEAVNQFLPSIRWLIESALDNTDITFEQAKVYITNGTWPLILGFDEEGEVKGAVTLSLVNQPNDRTATIVTMGGWPGVVNRHNFDQVCSIAKALGATKIQALSTRNGARLFRRVGFIERSVLVEMKVWVD